MKTLPSQSPHRLPEIPRTTNGRTRKAQQTSAGEPSTLRPLLRLGRCLALAAGILGAVGQLDAQTNSQSFWVGTSDPSALRTNSNWNPNTGNLSVSTDSIFNNVTTNATLTATSATAGSMNANGTSTFRIFNNTGTSTNSTLTLGGAGNNGNSFSGTPSDLIFVSSQSNFTIQGPSAGSGVLRVSLGQSGTFNINGSAQISAPILGSGFGITKTGAGTLRLSGTNTYTGATTIDSGTLAVDGSLASGSSVFVNSGGTLAGNGTVNGLATLNSGANLTPGNGVGNLNFNGGLTLNSASTVTMEINGDSTFDTINVTVAAPTYAGALSLVFGYTPTAGQTYQLFTGLAGTGNFTSLAFSNAEYQGTFDPSNGQLTLTAVPEPKTLLMVALGASFLLWRARGRKAGR